MIKKFKTLLQFFFSIFIPLISHDFYLPISMQHVIFKKNLKKMCKNKRKKKIFSDDNVLQNKIQKNDTKEI